MALNLGLLLGCHMRRMFLPVGQGAFYCERFFPGSNDESINVVYDCGSFSKGKLEREIKSLFKEKETIHAVFISHFHEDHVNGLPFLLDHCRVKRIYYPFLDDQAKSLMGIWLAANGQNGGVAFQFLQNARRWVSRWSRPNTPPPELIPVLPNLEVDEQLQQSDPEDSGLVSGTSISLQRWSEKDKRSSLGSLDDWFFIPFNFRQEELIKKLKTTLDSIKGDWISLLNDKLKSEEWEEVREVYKKVAPDCNLSSMTLFSGLKNPEVCQRGNCWDGGLDADWMTPAGCLYTGDYKAQGELQWTDLNQVYSPYWDYIGCIQIPHHGSKNDFNVQFCKDNTVLVASAGWGNPYCMPSGDVLQQCADAGCELNVVSQERRSRVDLVVCSKKIAEKVWVGYFCMFNACRCECTNEGCWEGRGEGKNISASCVDAMVTGCKSIMKKMVHFLLFLESICKNMVKN